MTRQMRHQLKKPMMREFTIVLYLRQMFNRNEGKNNRLISIIPSCNYRFFFME